MLEEKRLLATLHESDRRVQNVRQRIALVEGFLDERDRTASEFAVVGKNPVYEELEQDLIVARAKLASEQARLVTLEAQLGELDGDFQTMTTTENTLRRLEREREIQEQNYQTFAARLEESRLSEEMDRRKIVSLSVIEKAAPPRQSIAPNRKVKLAVGVAFGVGLGVLLCFAAHFLRQDVTTPFAVERHLGVPLLVTIDRQEMQAPKLPLLSGSTSGGVS
jgi:hypothetical protein